MIVYSRREIGGLDCVICRHRDADPQPTAGVILCHGFGASGTDLVPIAGEMLANHAELRGAVFVFPAAPIELDMLFGARAWWPIDVEQLQLLMVTGQFRELRQSIPDELADCRQMIGKIIQFLQSEQNLLTEQIVVGGFSQGAMLATDVALNCDCQMGGLLIWSGSLINESAWKLAAASCPKLDIVQSHGRLDPILPFAGAELLRDMLRQASHSVEFIAFDDQHTIPAAAIPAGARLIGQVNSRTMN